MIIRNSIRQLLRMKGRCVLFLLTLAFAAGLFSLGRGFQIINQEKTAAYEDTFMTIGTVEQKADEVEQRREWQADTQTWSMYTRNVFRSQVPVEVLDFEGADYLSGPEKRVCYGAYMPEYRMFGNGDEDGLTHGIIVEVSPLEDALPDHPVRIRIKKIWKGYWIREGDIINFCDHWNPKPGMLYADKTYVMCLYDHPSHGGDGVEYVPDTMLCSTQTDLSGKKVPDGVEEGYFCEEVTDGFWESERSRRWRNAMEVWDWSDHVFPVTGTCNINLMMAFYNQEVAVVSGRGFTQEEYDRGEKVCLIPERFAMKNDLAVGDRLRIPLLVSCRWRSGGRMSGSAGTFFMEFLNAKGEPYEIFEDSVYTVTGIYGGNSGLYDDYGMGYNEILIPSRSVKNSDEDNIVSCGPMRGETTSFQIENGIIDEYMEKWSRLGIDHVEITFYDKGYTELEANLNNMRQIAWILMAAGTVMVLMVLGYFSWIFILRQRERTAIERSLGFRRSQCFVSLFCGMFLILALGACGGCAVGSHLAGDIAGSLGQTVYYDTSFGNSVMPSQEDAVQEKPQDMSDGAALERPFPAVLKNMLLILAAGAAICSAGIVLNLRQEPMKMFGSRRE